MIEQSFPLIGSRLPLGPVWGSAIGFVTLMVGLVFAMGFGSRSLAVSSLAAYVMFSYFAIQTDIAVLDPLFYATLVLIIVAFAFKVLRQEGVMGESA